ncbi:hypothetical protein DNTS_003267 [Danionella cerebrum]|uniref:Matrin-type domain-containing protein n=1 Tax=Danionella cerebrum TaxID=2873325 RepID=A0A553MVF9_9TELE|nr:hypothetical protein DNTS_003267 [Danionella translucida]
MFNPHQHHPQHQHQLHQHLRQLQHLFQQQTPPPPPPPPPPPQPPPAHHITHHHQAQRPPPARSRMVNLCSATQAIIAPNPMLQGALLMQQMQGSMRGFPMGAQQFPQFFAAGSRASLLGPVPVGVTIKSPHVGFARHFPPHPRYFSSAQEFQTHPSDRKRENEQKTSSQSEASSSQSEQSRSNSKTEPSTSSSISSQSVTSSRGGNVDPGSQSDEPAAKKHRTQTSEETESGANAEEKSSGLECEGLAAEEPEDTEAEINSQLDQDSAEAPEGGLGLEKSVTEEDCSDSLKQIMERAAEPSGSFVCYICNITSHNQQVPRISCPTRSSGGSVSLRVFVQSFQSHMNSLSHQQKMMEIQHMSSACLVTLLPRVQQSLQGSGAEELLGLCSREAAGAPEVVPELPNTLQLQPSGTSQNTPAQGWSSSLSDRKRCSRSSSTSCTVCKLNFQSSGEFVEHMQSSEHKQHVQQLWKESGSNVVEDLNRAMLLGEEEEDADDCSEDEGLEDENGKEGLSAQMEVTLEDLSEDEEFDADTVYGSSFLVPAAGFLCRLCDQFYHFESSARDAHCKSLTHFQNLKRYKALKKLQASGSVSAEHTPTNIPSCTSPTQEVSLDHVTSELCAEEEEQLMGKRARNHGKRRGRGRGGRKLDFWQRTFGGDLTEVRRNSLLHLKLPLIQDGSLNFSRRQEPFHEFHPFGNSGAVVPLNLISIQDCHIYKQLLSRNQCRSCRTPETIPQGWCVIKIKKVFVLTIDYSRDRINATSPNIPDG